MSSDSEEALSWEGDRDPASPPSTGARRSGARRDRAASVERDTAADPAVVESSDQAAAPLSNTMLLITGIVGGVYLLYAVGWLIGGLRLQPLARFFVADAMFLPWFVLAIASPLLWFVAVWVLTRGRAAWIRASLLLLGVVLLVPWPFVTVGVIGV